MKRTWTIIGVKDVRRSFKWYQSLFGQAETSPAHDYFGQIADTDGTVLLCLHQWGAHEHPTLVSPMAASPGNGLILFFRVHDYEMSLKRGRDLVERLEEESHINPNTQTNEFSLRDPDGYYVTISALSAQERESEFPPAVPEIPVSALNTAIEYYENNLGFTVDWGREGDGIAGISKGSCRMFLASRSFRERYGNLPRTLVWLNLESKAEVDELYETWRESGARIVSPPESKPWKLHEFTVEDPDGNLFRVFYDFSRDTREE